jgi:hypothetical protein
MHPHNNLLPGEAENAGPSVPLICIIDYTKISHSVALCCFQSIYGVDMTN